MTLISKLVSNDCWILWNFTSEDWNKVLKESKEISAFQYAALINVKILNENLHVNEKKEEEDVEICVKVEFDDYERAYEWWRQIFIIKIRCLQEEYCSCWSERLLVYEKLASYTIV